MILKTTHTILLVDDNEVNRYLAKFALERAGFQVITAADGAEALRQASTHRPSLVLMDLLMPVMDGYEATQRLKADPQLSAIPVAALTACVTVADRSRARDAGCDGCIDKPIDVRRFAQQVAGYLSEAAR